MKGKGYKIPRIFIDKNGNWYQDGIKITHKWTYLENNKNLRCDNDGNYFVQEGKVKIPVDVEDTPFVIKMVEKKDTEIYAILNDNTTEKISLDKVWLNEDNIPYTKVKNNGFIARFLRPAYYELAKFATVEEDKLVLEINGEKYNISKKFPN